jgi:hypothetical protein
VARVLEHRGHAVDRLHSDRSQAQRQRALESFRRGRVRVLVATDIAARGIDVADIGHVVNYDLPHVPEDYVHRIGRTARAAASGRASSFVAPEDSPLLHAIERFTRARVPEGQVPRGDAAFQASVEVGVARQRDSRAPAAGAWGVLATLGAAAGPAREDARPRSEGCAKTACRGQPLAVGLYGKAGPVRLQGTKPTPPRGLAMLTRSTAPLIYHGRICRRHRCADRLVETHECLECVGPARLRRMQESSDRQELERRAHRVLHEMSDGGRPRSSSSTPPVSP